MGCLIPLVNLLGFAAPGSPHAWHPLRTLPRSSPSSRAAMAASAVDATASASARGYCSQQPAAHTNLQIVRANNLLLTRIEHNCPYGLTGCKDVVIYNHGFPDSSIVPTAAQDFAAASTVGAGWPEGSYFSSRLPRKWCEYIIKQLANTAFVAFNTRGVPGSSSSADPETVETAPDDFEKKTLIGLMGFIIVCALFHGHVRVHVSIPACYLQIVKSRLRVSIPKNQAI